MVKLQSAQVTLQDSLNEAMAGTGWKLNSRSVGQKNGVAFVLAVGCLLGISGFVILVQSVEVTSGTTPTTSSHLVVQL